LAPPRLPAATARFTGFKEVSMAPATLSDNLDALAAHPVPLVRLDGRAIVGAVLLGTVATLLLQLAERADTALFGGTVVPLGILVLSTAGLLAAFLYGPIAGLIAVEINPFVSTLTATGPLAWFWFLNNLLFILPASLVMVRLQPMNRWWKWSLAALAGAVPAFLALIPIQLNVMGLPLATALNSFAAHVAWEAVGPATAAWLLARVMLKLGAGR
jgi:hypothetical protein